MRKFLASFLLVLCLGGLMADFSPVFAQKLTREQRREYRRRGKALKQEFKQKYNTPEKFAQFKQENKQAKTRLDSLKQELERLRASEARTQEELEMLKTQQAAEDARLKAMESRVSQARMRGLPQKGAFFAVQAGNLNTTQLLRIMEQNPDTDLNVAADDKGNDLFIIGVFQTSQTAAELQRHIKAMGIRNTQVVAYQDGKPANNKRR